MARATTGLALACAVSTSIALQGSLSGKQGLRAHRDDELKLIMLDESEVERRGSHCLDGSTPGFYFEEGSSDGNFLFWMHGGGYCTSEADCASYLPIHDWVESVDSDPIFKHSYFQNYHHVYILNCDLGIYMGDRSEPVVYNGNKLYFQGARILKHIVDTVQANYTMKEVIVSGGSGGGHSLYAVADYFKGLMPNVEKFGVAPINGWYIGDHSALADMYTLQNMQGVVSEACKSSLSSSEQFKCLDPATAYRHTESKIFMTQILDYTFEWNVSSDVKTAYEACLSTESTSAEVCDSGGVELLQGYLNNYTQLLASYPRYYLNGEGGYLSTCTKHTFYTESDLWDAYANGGKTVGDAISEWWQRVGTNSAAVWYLPCTLGSAPNPQCESSCAASR